MNYYKDQKVVIKNQDNKFVDGILLDRVDFGEEEHWWVKYENNVSIISIVNLNEWNTTSLEDYCVCGSIATDQPGHSDYCNLK